MIRTHLEGVEPGKYVAWVLGFRGGAPFHTLADTKGAFPQMHDLG